MLVAVPQPGVEDGSDPVRQLPVSPFEGLDREVTDSRNEHVEEDLIVVSNVLIEYRPELRCFTEQLPNEVACREGHPESLLGGHGPALQVQDKCYT